MSDETRSPLFSEDTKLPRMPLKFAAAIVATVAAGAIAWALTTTRVADQGRRLDIVETQRAADHDILLEIRSDLKALSRERRPTP